VVIQEIAKIDGRRVTLPAGQEPGQNRRLAGEDLEKGRPALRAGRLLRPADLGLVASLGIGEVSVRRKLKVAFF
jgi:molybdopterin molybdotransferase